MSATDEYRRMLTERGVEYRAYDRNSSDTVTWFDLPDGREVCFEEYDGGTTHFRVWRETPEQAIAATLGRGNVGKYVGLRRGEYWERTENSDYYCGGCGWKVTDHDSYCPECGGALHSCNCTDSERTTTVDETETLHARGDTWGTKEFDKKVIVHVMECSACGHTYEHVNGDYEFCPHCGRRIVRENE